MTLAGGFADAAPRILVHGHRGARAVLPENTIPAFEHAIEVGADFLELDLAVTRDNVLVVSHDPVLPKSLCTGGKGTRVIREMSFEELRAWDCGALKNPDFPEQKPVPGTRVPSLDEVLALSSRGSFGFNLETKISPLHPNYTPSPEEFARLVLAAVRRHGLEKRALLQSFDFRTLHAMKRLAPEFPLAALYGAGWKDFPTIAEEAGARTVSPQFTLVTPEKVAQAHAAGLQVVPWTANRPEEWDKLVAAGVDAIITDHPAALIAYLKARGLR